MFTQRPLDRNRALQFRSEEHVVNGGAEAWLDAGGFELNAHIASTRSSGEPRGPYVGPVFSKRVRAGRVQLHGSQYWEGTYFVFVEPHAQAAPADAPAGH